MHGALSMRSRLVALAAAFVACDQFATEPRFQGRGTLPVGEPGQCVSVTPTFSAEPSSEGAAPPPISGGSLIVLADGHTAVAADAERDAVWVADVSAPALVKRISLQPGDEPGRVTEGPAGRVSVALRRGGAVVSIDAATGMVLSRRAVCAEPRGLVWNPGSESLHVACASGELVTLPDDGGAARTVLLDRDLRDVVLGPYGLVVTRFRSATVTVIGASGGPVSAAPPPQVSHVPSVAWRAVALPGGAGVLMVHQLARIDPVEIGCKLQTAGMPATEGPFDGGFDSGGGLTSGTSPYGGDPGSAGGNGGGNGAEPVPPRGVVAPALTWFKPSSSGSQPTSVGDHALGVLPVDVAVSSDCHMAAVVSAGSDRVTLLQRPGAQCGELVRTGVLPVRTPIAAAFDGSGRLVVQTRRPAGLTILGGGEIAFPGAEDRFNSGHQTFHQDTGRGIACASCHPEARDDGRTWRFTMHGGHPVDRRTPQLGGGLLSTAPFHWDGEFEDLGALMNDVFVRRMGGSMPFSGDFGPVARWIDSVPAPMARAAKDPAAVASGRQLFTSAQLGCSSCHWGPHLTNNATLDVGTGGAFQVPSLVGLASRGPFMHAGCARTLADRFSDPSCGGGDFHGRTSQLHPWELSDLIAYLETL